MKNLKNMDLQEMSKSEMEKFNGGEDKSIGVMEGVMIGGLVTVGVSTPFLVIVPPVGAVMAIAGLTALLGAPYCGMVVLMVKRWSN